jgi:hypothetical protein
VSDLEDKINAVLGDPKQMQEITKLAKSLMGGGEKEAASEKVSNPAEDMGLDQNMLKRLGRIMGESRSDKPEQQALLEAMKPYLSEKRRSKMDRAMKMAKLARIAKIAMEDMGGDGTD